MKLATCAALKGVLPESTGSLKTSYFSRESNSRAASPKEARGLYLPLKGWAKKHLSNPNETLTCSKQNWLPGLAANQLPHQSRRRGLPCAAKGRLYDCRAVGRECNVRRPRQPRPGRFRRLGSRERLGGGVRVQLSDHWAAKERVNDRPLH